MAKGVDGLPRDAATEHPHDMKFGDHLLPFCALVLLPGVAAAQTTNSWLAGNGNHWTNSANWSLGVVPDSSHEALVPGTNKNEYVGGDIVIDGDAHARNITANAGTYAFIITNGGTLTLHLSGNSIFTAGTGTRAFAIHAGSALIDASGGGNCIRAFLNVHEGAMLSGFDDFRTGATVMIDGGVWTPGSLAAAGTGKVVLNQAHVQMKRGTLRLALFGDGVARCFEFVTKENSSSLDLSGGNIVLVPQDGYVPRAGHSYVLWKETVPALAIVAGDGRNIAVEGHPGIALDLRAWSSEGRITIGNPGTAIVVR
jgi:hypothetical protein